MIYKITLFILFVISMYPWFLWNVSPLFICLFGSIVSFIFFALNRRLFVLRKKNVVLNVLLILSFIVYSLGFSLIGALEQLFVFISIFFLLNTRDDFKVEIFDFLTKGMSILVGVSLGFYLLYLVGIPFLSVPITQSALGYTGVNYFFFLGSQDTIDIIRFRSIFAEPGHLSMGLIPLLFANKFNLKNKYVLVLFIVELFTLSLAGVISIIIGLLIYSFSGIVKKIYPRIVIIALTLFSILYIGSLEDDNLLYLAIVSRLMIDDSKGTIAGYNRTAIDTDAFYSRYIKSPQFYMGLGNNKVTAELEGAGYKIFMIRFGLITTLLIGMFYFVFMLQYRQYEIFGFFIIFMLLLYQNSYPFWFCIIFSYITGIAKLKDYRKRNVSLKSATA